MINEKEMILAANVGGISNRVKCLVSMWRLADLFDKKLILEWHLNHTCGCEFKDLFENDIPEISLEELAKTPESTYLVSNTFRFVPLPNEIPDNFAKVYPTPRGNNIDFEFERVPEEVRENILVYLRKLKPIETIRRIVDAFTEKYDVTNLVGVHIRRDDFMIGKERLGEVSTDDKFSLKMKELLKEDPSTKFLFCSDCPSTEIKFNEEFGDKIIIYPKKNRDRTTKLNTQQGLIDLLLLSKTKHIIGTYRSTFNELAWWLGECKAKVDIIIDEGKKEIFESNKKKLDKSITMKSKRFVYKVGKKAGVLR